MWSLECRDILLMKNVLDLISVLLLGLEDLYLVNLLIFLSRGSDTKSVSINVLFWSSSVWGWYYYPTF